MTVRIVHKNSSTSGRNPTTNQLTNGEIAVNYNNDGCFLSVRSDTGRIHRVGGIWLSDDAPDNPAQGAIWVDTNDNNSMYVWDFDLGANGQWRDINGSTNVAGVFTIDVQLINPTRALLQERAEYPDQGNIIPIPPMGSTTQADANQWFVPAIYKLDEAVAVQIKSAPPSARFDGDLYFNTSTNILYLWNGTSWMPAGSGGGGGGGGGTPQNLGWDIGDHSVTIDQGGSPAVIPVADGTNLGLTTGSYNDLENKPDLFSGSYNDLTDKPDIPENTSDLTNDGDGTSNFVTFDDLGSFGGGLQFIDTLDATTEDPTKQPPEIGDLYVNTGAGTTTAAWGSQEITLNDRLLLGENGWDIIPIPDAPEQVTNTSQLTNDGEGGDPFATTDQLFSGSYNDLTDKPDLFSGSYNDLTDKPDLKDGTVTSITPGTGLQNEATDDQTAITEDGTIGLTDTGVVADTYGDGTNVPQITVDAQGRITSVDNIAIDVEAGSSVGISDTPPADPSAGDLWWNSTDGRLYIWYEDGDTDQWVDASPPGSLDDGGVITPNLQQVTDAGNTTSNGIDINSNIKLNADGSAFLGLARFNNGTQTKNLTFTSSKGPQATFGLYGADNADQTRGKIQLTSADTAALDNATLFTAGTVSSPDNVKIQSDGSITAASFTTNNFDIDEADAFGSRASSVGTFSAKKGTGSTGEYLRAYQGTAKTLSINAVGLKMDADLSTTANPKVQIYSNGTAIFGASVAGGRLDVSDENGVGAILDKVGVVRSQRASSTAVNQNTFAAYHGKTKVWWVDGSGASSFSAGVSAAGLVLNLETDNDANYVTTTVEGEEERIYNGPTLDVKEVLLDLQQRVNDRDAVIATMTTTIADLTSRVAAMEGGSNNGY